MIGGAAVIFLGTLIIEDKIIYDQNKRNLNTTIKLWMD